MNFNDQQKSYIASIAKELTAKVRNYLSSLSETEEFPSEHHIAIEPDPKRELFWNERFHIGVNLRFPPSKYRHIFMDIELVSWNKFVKVSMGVADEDFINFLPFMDKNNIEKKMENIIYTLFEKVDSI